MIKGEYIAPWGQVYSWSVEGQSFRIWTTSKTGSSRDQSFPAGLAFDVAKTIARGTLDKVLEKVFAS